MPKKIHSEEEVVAVNSSATTNEEQLRSISEYKKSNIALVNNELYKKDLYIPISDSFNSAIGLPGIPKGHITILRGHSNTAKTTALLELAVQCQKMGILPVLLITELKWSWEHLMELGFSREEKIDSKGNISYEGFYIYEDIEHLKSIEQVSSFINSILEDQKNGKIPMDVCFLWDSIGSVPCEMSLRSNNDNAEWNAKALSTTFSYGINQRILLSRKKTSKYTNTLVIINKVWVDKGENPYDPPVLKNKGGNAMFNDASLVITFGSVKKSGISKIKATKNGKEVEFAIRIKISIDKNHRTGLQTFGKVLATKYGFLEDTKEAIEEFKKKHSNEWIKYFNGDEDFDIIETKDDNGEILNTDEFD